MTQAVDLITKGQYLRATEAAAPMMVSNVLKGVRMWANGATTQKGRILFEAGEDRQLQLSVFEAGAQGLGFTPERLSKSYSIQEENRNLQERYRDMREAIRTRYRFARTGKVRLEIIKMAMDYNRKVARFDNIVPSINIKELRRKQKPRGQETNFANM